MSLYVVVFWHKVFIYCIHSSTQTLIKYKLSSLTANIHCNFYSCGVNSIVGSLPSFHDCVCIHTASIGFFNRIPKSCCDADGEKEIEREKEGRNCEGIGEGGRAEWETQDSFTQGILRLNAASQFCVKGTNTEWGVIVVPEKVVTEQKHRLCKRRAGMAGLPATTLTSELWF